MHGKLVLGSASPRRLELLRQIGITPSAICPADIDETPLRDEPPRDYTRRMAREKLQVLHQGQSDVCLCADTTVAVGRRILGKPTDRDEAARFLSLMSGRRHRVMTAIAIGTPQRTVEKLVESIVRFRPLTHSEIAAYLDSDEWQGKAGGYAIQGRAAAFIPWIQGSFTSIVGLPLAETATMLAGFGILGDMK